MSVIACVLLLTASAHATTSCSGTVNIAGSLTLSDDYESTSATNTCLRVTAANATLNCNGHEIRCNNASNCTLAISVEQNGGTVKNCYIVSAAGDWNIGIANVGTNFIATTTVLNNVVQNAGVGVLVGKTIKQNVFSGITNQCITAALAAFPAGSDIRENYCQSASGGLGINGPASGTACRCRRTTSWLRIRG